LVELIRGAHFDDVGVCFDFGHAHMEGSVSESFEILRKYICSTHVHDNAKDKDSHLWPGQGTINWKEAMELFRSAPQTPPLLLELAEDEKVSALEKLPEIFDKLETA
jgi:sugar phosphate isomerase/epimerase